MAVTKSSRTSHAFPPTNTNNYNYNVNATSSHIASSPASDQGFTQEPSSSSSQSGRANELPPHCKDNVDEDEWPDEEPYDDPDEPGEEVDNEEDYEGNIPPQPGLEEAEGDD